MSRWIIVFVSLVFVQTSFSHQSNIQEETLYWIKFKAQTKEQRAEIASTGAVIESILDDIGYGTARESELQQVLETGLVEQYFVNTTRDFPDYDSNFHNYTEVTNSLATLAKENPDIAAFESIGKSVEGRDIGVLKLAVRQNQQSKTKPAILFLGTHHAREHLSTEIPLLLAHYLVNEFRNSNPEVVRYFKTRIIYIIPLVNPDGSEYDISDGRYRAWRKNTTKNNTFSYGVDLNRNYGYKWGVSGSSSNPSSDVYKGKAAFSEPETQAVKKFVDSHSNINVLLSFHTYSELILYPWGYGYDKISDERDYKVHKTMAETMAQWNNYTPQQASDLYPASGDTADWAYGVHKIISFTFELDPKGFLGTKGFYPGQKVIPYVFQKNLKPCLYLIEHTDNPYRVLQSQSKNYGLNSSLLN